MNSRWSENLRKRMEAHKEPSPEGLWDDIEQSLKAHHSTVSSFRQNKIQLWSKRFGSVAAVLLIVLSIGYYVSDKHRKDHQLTTPIIHEKKNIEQDITTHIDRNLFVAENKTQLTVGKAGKTLLGLNGKSAIKDTIDLIAKADDKTLDPKSETVNSNKKGTGENPSLKQHSSNLNQDEFVESTVTVFVNRRKNNPAKWEANLYTSNLSAGSTSRYDGYDTLGSEGVSLEEDNGDAVGEDPYGNILVENQYKEVYTDVKHKQPFTVGVSVNYNITDKWGLTSGLTYTILSSELRSGSDNYYYKSEQTIHYIGIPLNINYTVWRNKKLSVYFSGGGLVEKSLSGKLITDYVVDNKVESTKKDNIEIDPLQWSLNTAAGIQYNLSKRTGLYIEPGASYYFKSKSEIETIYKEKAFNPSVRFGVRFSISR